MQVTYGKGFRRAQSIAVIEKALLTVPQVDCPIREFWVNGLYAREITIPKGVTLIGVVHTTENFAVLKSGRLRLSTDTGPIEIAAGHMLVVKPGQKNAAYALEDSVWTNFFANPTNEKNSDVLVEKLSTSKATDLIGGSTNKQIAANKAVELEY